MKSAAFACTAVLALATACFHTKEVASPNQEERAAQQGSEEEEAATEEEGGKAEKNDEVKGDSEQADTPPEKEPGAKPAASKKRASADAKSDKDEQDGDDAINPEEIPVASSPQGLLKPGADEKVREKLGVSKGGMRKALMNFQREHDLPATGMLDHETVEKLGLDPNDIFKKEG